MRWEFENYGGGLMKERPILFNSEMVRAILEGRKTQTRRVCKLEGYDGGELYEVRDGILYPVLDLCPYGKPGDRLWVRETHYLFGKWIKNGKTKTGRQKWKFKCLRKEALYLDNPPATISTKKTDLGWFKRPSIFMPRWASRIILETTEIRVERVQEISEEDATAEGVAFTKYINATARYHFKELWDSINAKRGFGWDKNSYVWVLTLKRVYVTQISV